MKQGEKLPSFSFSRLLPSDLHRIKHLVESDETRDLMVDSLSNYFLSLKDPNASVRSHIFMLVSQLNTVGVWEIIDPIDFLIRCADDLDEGVSDALVAALGVADGNAADKVSREPEASSNSLEPPFLRRMANWIYPAKIDKLRLKIKPRSIVKATPNENTKPVNRKIGTVKWFNEAKGYGFITPDEGGKDVFLHISIVEKSGTFIVKPRQKVIFEVSGDPKPADKQMETAPKRI